MGSDGERKRRGVWMDSVLPLGTAGWSGEAGGKFGWKRFIPCKVEYGGDDVTAASCIVVKQLKNVRGSNEKEVPVPGGGFLE